MLWLVRDCRVESLNRLDSRGKWVVPELTNGSVLQLLNCRVNRGQRNEKPFPGLDVRAETILQLQVQSSTAKKTMKERFERFATNIG